MDHIVHISSAPESYGRFALEQGTGTLIFQGPAAPLILVRRRIDNAIAVLAPDQPVEVAEIYDDELYVFTETGDAGVFEFRFRHLADEQEQLFTVSAIVADVLIDCDADRDGTVGLNEEGKANWTWGDNGRGAIVLVDNDRDPLIGGIGFLEEREPIVVRPLGVEHLPQDVSLRLSTAPEGAMKFSVFRKKRGDAEKLIGRAPSEPVQALIASTDNIDPAGETLYVAAHEYPGPFFEGLIIITLELVHSFGNYERVLASDRIMMRVAPWVMTPNTQPAKKVFTCEISAGGTNNQEFLNGLKDAMSREGLPLEIIPTQLHRGDRWIQDEIEIGYTRSHRGSLPVVFDSPRDRGLDDYPEIGLLGEDFGHFVVGGGVPNSLDSFGNLEVSPPVVVNGNVYPLGRIIVGGRQQGDFSHESRQMMAEVRQFLYSQKVQSPFEVFTDWLAVGHVDEIVSFVPDENAAQGFKTLIASPELVKTILHGLSADGHGSTLLFEGKRRLDGNPAQLTVDEMLNLDDFWDGNGVYQTYMSKTRDLLKQELGISDSDIVEIPVCFQVRRNRDRSLSRTLAFFPDMINHLVHNDLSIVPKPYGPVIDGKCAFEKAFEDALPGRRVVFIDDWYSYHELSGEVHCGTNAMREPFAVSKWWQLKPEGGFDIKTTGFINR